MKQAERSVEVHLISHTHWDREWYLTREQYRHRLGELIDGVLERMDADPRFTAFHLDGQTVVLEDYLEVRPEAASRLRQRVGEGRILVGPWYVMPDMHLVSGEALVRNLALGHRIAADFGGVMKAGYLPDPFGHVAQMPQILAGFGLDSAILWRGFGGESAEYIWEAPDRTSVMLLHLPREGYCNALRLPLVDPADRPAAAARLVARESRRSHTGVLLFMAGVDHVEPAAGLLDLSQEIGGLPGVRGALSTLPAYVNGVRRALDKVAPTLTVVKGELRSGEDYAPLLPGVLSARTYLKQANAAAQRLLEQRAEPLSAFAWLIGGRYPAGELAYAWRTLLQNHPHDSICGCSIDEVHEECESRFARASQAALAVEERALETLASAVEPPPPSGVLRFVIVNTDIVPWDGVVVGEVDIPLASAEPERHLDPELLERPFTPLGPDARIAHVVDADGTAVPFQVLAEENRIVHFMSRVESPLAVQVRRVRLALRTQVPACGLVALDASTAVSGQSAPVPEGGAGAGYRGLENEIYRVELSEGATLEVWDKRTGRRLQQVAELVDSGDVGDEYNYDPPRRDAFVTSREAKDVAVEVLNAGPLIASLRVSFKLEVPEAATTDRKGRAKESTPLVVSMVVSLRAGSPRIDFDLTVDNTARDHRLRVVFPTGAERVETARADSAFAVVERPARRPVPASFSVEAPVSNAPLLSFVDAGDAKAGVSLLSEGLNEYEVTDDVAPRLALTLLRCVGWLSRDDLGTRHGNAGPALETPGAQCLESHRFGFALIPRNEPPSPQSLYASARGFLSPPRLAAPAGRSGRLPRRHTFFAVEGGEGVVLSALKRADDRQSLVLRLFNPGSTPATARVSMPGLSEAHRLSLAEARLAKRTARERGVSLTLRPAGIDTVELVPRDG